MAMLQNAPSLAAKGKYVIFKRRYQLQETDTPQVISFLGSPETAAGLHALANYGTRAPDSVIAPFSSGICRLPQDMPAKAGRRHGK